MEDAGIIALFWARDQQAIRETEQKYGGRLYRLAVRILEDRQDAEESVSDTYWRAWNTMPPTRPGCLFAYLAKLCRCSALDKLDWNRARKRQAQIVELSAELESTLAAPEDRTLELAELGRLLNCFLEGLSGEKRAIFLRRYWFGDSVGEIADRFGMGESRVKTMLFRLRRSLRDFLKREGALL